MRPGSKGHYQVYEKNPEKIVVLAYFLRKMLMLMSANLSRDQGVKWGIFGKVLV